MFKNIISKINVKEIVRTTIVVLATTAAISMLVAGTVLILPVIHSEVAKSYVKDSVYHLSIHDRQTDQYLGAGTGFVTQRGDGREVVVTNSHVCVNDGSHPMTNGEPLVVLRTDDGRDLTVLAYDPVNDLCALSIPRTQIKEKPLKLAESAISDGEVIFIYGHPSGGTAALRSGQFLNEMTIIYPIGDRGLVVKNFPKVKCTDLPGMYAAVSELECIVTRKTTASELTVLPGNSGSPLFNKWGNVVGVLWGYNPSTRMAMGVTLEALKKFLGYR